MMLSALAENNIGKVYGNDVSFDAVSTDTRTIKAGQLFVALRGENFDAHTLLDDAFEKEACALVVEKECDIELPQLVVKDTTLALGQISAQIRKEFNGRVVGVTGSSGKTTVKGMLHAVLSRAGRCLATQGNYNNHIGVPLTLARINNDYDFAVVEAGMSNPGEISYLANLIKPDVAVVTNVQAAHIGRFESLSDVAKEKTDLYHAENLPIAIVNLDDAEVVSRLPEFSQNTVIGFSRKEKPAALSISGYVSAQNVVIDRRGCAGFDLKAGNRDVHVQLSVPGAHNVNNALAVAAAAIAFDVDLEKIKAGLESFTGVSGRMQVLAGPKKSVLVNDTYNANPGSVKAAIDYLANFEDAILVCGDMGELGEQSQSLHKEVGVYANANAISLVYTVGETSQDISEAAKNGQHFNSKESLIEELEKQISDKTVVLVKGSRSAAMESVVEALVQEGNN